MTRDLRFLAIPKIGLIMAGGQQRGGLRCISKVVESYVPLVALTIRLF